MPTQQAVSLNASRILNTVGTPPKQQWNGTYMASVVQNNDPLGEGRVTLYIPQVLGTAVSNWARPQGYGSMAIPQVGQMVHASFNGGDINHPVYSYVSLSTVNSEIATLQSQVTTLQAQVTALQAQPSAWSAITLATNWSNTGGSDIPAQVRTVMPGVAQIGGILNYGAAGSLSPGTSIGTLPSPFIPSTYFQILPVAIIGVSTSDAFIGTVTGQTDLNGLTDGTTGGQSGIVVAGNAGSNTHQHFPGTYAVNNGQHVHTNLSAGQAATINQNLSYPFIEINSLGVISIWNCSANVSQIVLSGTYVI